MNNESISLLLYKQKFDSIFGHTDHENIPNEQTNWHWNQKNGRKQFPLNKNILKILCFKIKKINLLKQCQHVVSWTVSVKVGKWN